MKKIVCKGCKTVMVGKNKDGKPSCPICYGISPFSGMPEEVEVPIEDATCTYCKIKASQTMWDVNNLPFYNASRNTFYCGCRGWN